MELHKRHKPVVVAYEKYGMQSDIEHIKSEQRRLNYRFAIAEVGGSMAKNDRIRRLVPDFEQGRIYIKDTMLYTDYENKERDLTYEFVEQEYMAFPFGKHDDMLDALSRLYDAPIPLPSFNASTDTRFSSRTFNDAYAQANPVI